MDPNSVIVIREATDWGIWLQVIETMAVCLASGVAIFGITSWRREFTGKRKMELAEDVLALFYEAKDAIEYIRNPFSSSEEGSTRKRSESETPEQTKAWDKAYVAFERIEKRREVFNKLSSLRYRFMAQVGKKQAEPFGQMRGIVNQISQAASTLGQLWAAHPLFFESESGKQEYSKEIKKHEAVFWSQGKEDDIRCRTDGIVSRIEETCRKIIMRT